MASMCSNSNFIFYPLDFVGRYDPAAEDAGAQTCFLRLFMDSREARLKEQRGL
jgi:hypothetical protein